MKGSAELSRLRRRAKDHYSRGGLGRLFIMGGKKVGVLITAPAAQVRFKSRQFSWGSDRLHYLIHPYNATWRTERAVEIPIAQAFLADVDPSMTLEVGNVLSYYASINHRVVDKYEQAPNVENLDVVDINGDYDAIVAVSTLEHVGWDEIPQDPEKVFAAMAHLRALLTPNGRLLVTMPGRHHPGVDAFVISGETGADEELIFVQEGNCRWRLAEDRREFVERALRSVWVGIFRRA